MSYLSSRQTVDPFVVSSGKSSACNLVLTKDYIRCSINRRGWRHETESFLGWSIQTSTTLSDRVDPAIGGAEGPEGQPCAEGEVQESLTILRISPKTYTTMSTRWTKGERGISGSSQDLSWQGLQRHENPEFSLVLPFYLHGKNDLWSSLRQPYSVLSQYSGLLLSQGLVLLVKPAA